MSRKQHWLPLLQTAPGKGGFSSIFLNVVILVCCGYDDVRAGVMACVEAWGDLRISVSPLDCTVGLDETRVDGLPQHAVLPTEHPASLKRII